VGDNGFPFSPPLCLRLLVRWCNDPYCPDTALLASFFFVRTMRRWCGWSRTPAPFPVVSSFGLLLLLFFFLLPLSHSRRYQIIFDATYRRFIDDSNDDKMDPTDTFYFLSFFFFLMSLSRLASAGSANRAW